jgi:hypothetical protein
MPMVAVFFAVFVLGTPMMQSSSAQSQTIEYEVPWVIDRVTFDPARISKSELDKLMELSPALGRHNFVLRPETIETCKREDRGYHGCDSPYSFNPVNAELNLRSISARIQRLDGTKYAPELASVVQYVKSVQSLWLWKEQQKLRFINTNDIAVLEETHGPIDPGRSCQEVIDKIRDNINPEVRYQFAQHDWADCVWKMAEKALGEYPRKTWEAFLKSHSIQEPSWPTYTDGFKNDNVPDDL